MKHEMVTCPDCEGGGSGNLASCDLCSGAGRVRALDVRESNGRFAYTGRCEHNSYYGACNVQKCKHAAYPLRIRVRRRTARRMRRSLFAP